MADRAKRPPSEAMVDLRRRLSLLAPRDPARVEIMTRMADAYGVSVWTIYRALRELSQPKSVRRADHGRVRVASQEEMERYAEIGPSALLGHRFTVVLARQVIAGGF